MSLTAKLAVDIAKFYALLRFFTDVVAAGCRRIVRKARGRRSSPPLFFEHKLRRSRHCPNESCIFVAHHLTVGIPRQSRLLWICEPLKAAFAKLQLLRPLVLLFLVPDVVPNLCLIASHRGHEVPLGYPRARKCCPAKCRFRSSYTRARWKALFP